MTSHREQSTSRFSLGRRRFLLAGATAGSFAAAGCSAIVDFFAGLILEDVNIFNGTNRRVSGTIAVVDAAGEQVLDEEFEISGDDDVDDDNANGQNGDGENTNDQDGDGENTNDDDSVGTVGYGVDSRTDDGTTDHDSDGDDGEGDDERGDREPSDERGDREPSDESMVRFEDVLTDEGEYTVTIDLDITEDIGGLFGYETTVEVADPDEEHIMVFLGSDDPSEPIKITVIEEFTDLEEFDDD